MDDYKNLDNKHQIENLYRLIRRIRFFEEELSVLFGEGEVYGTAHTCIGQEAVAVGCLYDLQVKICHGHAQKPWPLYCQRSRHQQNDV